MATGDSNDMLARLKSLVPYGWFKDAAPIRDAVLGGISDALAWVYSFIAYAKLQTRIQTATDFWVDLIAYDFFGLGLVRKPGQSDAAFRARILAEVLRERVTRKGMTRALTDLTGNAPNIFEPWNTGDAAAIGYTFAAGVGFPVGSLQFRDQAFIVVYRPHTAGIANVAGVGSYGGGIGVGALTPVALSSQTGITDTDMYSAVTQTKPTGTIMWTQLV